jgi:hypothetical protein
VNRMKDKIITRRWIVTPENVEKFTDLKKE